jgi:hypothetical protein
MFRPSRVVDTRSSNAHPHSADAQCSPMIPASSSIGIFALSHAAPTWHQIGAEFVPPLVASRPFDQPFDALRARHRFRLTPRDHADRHSSRRSPSQIRAPCFSPPSQRTSHGARSKQQPSLPGSWDRAGRAAEGDRAVFHDKGSCRRTYAHNVLMSKASRLTHAFVNNIQEAA